MACPKSEILTERTMAMVGWGGAEMREKNFKAPL